jgi:3-oxoacyl-[acyl-carrier-protein] synthase I
MTMNASPSTSPIAIVAIGMITPVGLTTVQTVKSIRARISRIQESPLLDERWEPFTMGWLEEDLLPPLKPDLKLAGTLSPLKRRLLRLAGEPLATASILLPRVEETPLFLALPASLPGGDASLPADFLPLLAQQSGIPFNQRDSRIVPQGRAGFFLALQKAIEALQGAHAQDAVLVGGLDSYFDLELLKHYSVVENRILRSGVPDGFIPGEGAAVFMLSTPATCQRRGWTPHAVIQGVGLGMEEGHLYSDKPYRGDGLAMALGALFENTKTDPVRTVFAGFNGENLWAKEWGVGVIRNRNRFAEAHQMVHPAENIGDAGAALPAIMLGCAALGLQSGNVEGPALVFASSDHDPRGASLVSRYGS